MKITFVMLEASGVEVGTALQALSPLLTRVGEQ
jgi:hypothetical protein